MKAFYIISVLLALITPGLCTICYNCTYPATEDCYRFPLTGAGCETTSDWCAWGYRVINEIFNVHRTCIPDGRVPPLDFNATGTSCQLQSSGWTYCYCSGHVCNYGTFDHLFPTTTTIRTTTTTTRPTTTTTRPTTTTNRPTTTTRPTTRPTTTTTTPTTTTPTTTTCIPETTVTEGTSSTPGPEGTSTTPANSTSPDPSTTPRIRCNPTDSGGVQATLLISHLTYFISICHLISQCLIHFQHM